MGEKSVATIRRHLIGQILLLEPLTLNSAVDTLCQVVKAPLHGCPVKFPTNCTNGCKATGNGIIQLEKQFTILNVPSMSQCRGPSSIYWTAEFQTSVSRSGRQHWCCIATTPCHIATTPCHIATTPCHAQDGCTEQESQSCCDHQEGDVAGYRPVWPCVLLV